MYKVKKKRDIYTIIKWQGQVACHRVGATGRGAGDTSDITWNDRADRQVRRICKVSCGKERALWWQEMIIWDMDSRRQIWMSLDI